MEGTIKELLNKASKDMDHIQLVIEEWASADGIGDADSEILMKFSRYIQYPLALTMAKFSPDNLTPESLLDVAQTAKKLYSIIDIAVVSAFQLGRASERKNHGSDQ